MTDFRYIEFTDNWGDETWKIETRKKFPSGVTGILSFEPIDILSDEVRCYNVGLDLRRKRKRESGFREVTGRDGLEPASWVLQALTDFEGQDLVEASWPMRIEVQADDDRRWRLYERVLTKRGYSATKVDNQRTLVKRIEGRE